MATLRGRQRVAFDALIFSDGTTPNKPLLNLLACSHSGEHSELPGPIRELVLTDAAEFAEARTPRRAAQFQKGDVSHHWHSPLLLGRSMYDNPVYVRLRPRNSNIPRVRLDTSALWNVGHVDHEIASVG